MKFFDRLSNGWQLGMTSFRVIRENMSLLLFPVLSSAALIMVSLSFFGGFYLLFGADFEGWVDDTSGGNDTIAYLILFGYYLVNYFVIVFFNVGLVHCARLIFEGKEASISAGINFSISRIGAIFSWAMLAATVGVILRMLAERLGWIGQLIIGLIGVAWSIGTFFVVPVIAYENVGPIEAFKRSALIMKEKWGEAIGANFSFGLFFILGYILIFAGAFILFQLNGILAIVAAILSILFLHTVVSAAESVFVAATYNHLANQPAGYFDEDDVLDNVFGPKSK